MDELLAEEVRRQGNNACEYCRISQAFYPTIPFPIDHIIARQADDTPQLSLLLPPLQQPQGAEQSLGLIRKVRD